MESLDSKLDALLNQCKSNDVDVKIDALTKIQSEAESGIEINDSDALINVLKTCLRTSNQHLTTATLSALPPILPLLISRPVHLSQSRNGAGHGQSSSVHSSTSSSAPSSVVDAFTLRQVLNAFLPAGGLFERLGDKEKAQTKAREALVILGGFALRSSGTSTMSTGSRNGKGPETPLAIFERFLRENGLGSKAWKVREQSILTLVHIRRKHHIFPIRPYLPSLVDSLEDTDAHVRDCARQSVVELFSGPAVTDVARADLKKEMTKKGVRKTIVEGVLSKLLGASESGSNPQSREGSENGDTGPGKVKEYVPPSLALQGRKPSGASASGMSRTASASTIPRPASRAAAASPQPVSTPAAESSSDVNPVYIASTRDLENEFAGMAKAFEGKETEHNWAAREQSIQRVRGMLKGDVHQRYFDTFMACLKEGFIQWSMKTLASLRTTVATNTCSLYQELACALGHNLDPFCEILLTNLLKMAGFTKKITAQQSQASVTLLITHTSGSPRLFITLLWQGLQEKTVQARMYSVEHLRQYMEVHGQRAKNNIESSGGLEVLEKAMKKALGDATPAVRTPARICFWTFYEIWGDRGAAILESLDPLARKQLEKVCPNPTLTTSLPPPSTPMTAKKSSVAAAIAASRAKAKAIATAPPTLRHQATSAVPANRRSGSPSLSKSVSQTPRPSSPLRTSTSPPSPRSRIVSNGMQRSVSSTSAPSSHARSYSGNSTSRPISPPSPSAEHSFSRRISSPLATNTSPPRSSTVRKAMQTALPASPPESTNLYTVLKPIVQRVPPPVSIPARLSTLLPQLNTEDSLLLAQTIPVPDDSDSEGSVNLMSFSTPFEKYPPPPASNSQTQSMSPRSTDFKPMLGVSNALSTDSVTELSQAGGAPVVEDALRARAEQAESAAERLLELVEPDEDGTPLPSFPPSLLVGHSANGHATPKSKSKPSIPVVQPGPPVTPVNRAAAIMRQAALFTDSPAYNGKPTSLLDVLQDRRNETGWWLKRKTFLAKEASLFAEETSDPEADLQSCIMSLEQGSADAAVLKKLVLLCLKNPSIDALSPIYSDASFPVSPTPFASSHSLNSLHYDMWEKNKTFERLFSALTKHLVTIDNDSDIEYGLMVIWQMLESQAAYLEGREADIFSLLLRVRYCNKFDVLEATNSLRDALTTRIEPVYGLTTMHASLRTFHSEKAPSPADEDAKSASYAFGLIALGKFVLRLPAEIAEEEIPRLRATFISALNDTSSLVVREAAAAAIIAAQLVLRDETHLFVLLDGLADEKKNLLTYLFDKHGARGASRSSGPTGIDKLEKEMRRLDTRTSTPPRRLL